MKKLRFFEWLDKRGELEAYLNKHQYTEADRETLRDLYYKYTSATPEEIMLWNDIWRDIDNGYLCL